MECVPTNFKVAELVAAWKDSSLKINEEYQRGASWSTAQMQALVDSVFRKYPIPPIFLHQIKARGLGGAETVRYEIVDGQQRIRALAQFFSDQFSLLDPTDKKLKLPNSLRQLPTAWSKKRFSDLDETLRESLESKGLDAFLITNIANQDEIRDLFIRLQSGTALSRQQIRDAWPGSVGPFIEELAGKLKKIPSIALFKQVDKRGTGGEEERDPYESDRTFCAQLLCLFLARESDYRAQQSIGANELDKLYHENTTLDKNGQAALRFREILRLTTEVFRIAMISTFAGKDRKRTKFRKIDVMAATMLIQDLSRAEKFKFDSKFPDVLAAYVLEKKDLKTSGRSTSGLTIIRFYEEWRPGILEKIGVHLDPKRLFDDADKAAIYARDEGKCFICHEPVNHPDAEYHHYPTAYTLGGRTVVDNGRLVHSKCHPRGQAEGSDEE
jgi:hypothetical protein